MKTTGKMQILFTFLSWSSYFYPIHFDTQLLWFCSVFCSTLSHFPPISPWTAFHGYGANPVAWTSAGMKICHCMTAVSVVVPLWTVTSLIASSPGVSPMSTCHDQTLHIRLYPPTSYSPTKCCFFPCPRLAFTSKPFHEYIRQDANEYQL